METNRCRLLHFNLRRGGSFGVRGGEILSLITTPVRLHTPCLRYPPTRRREWLPQVAQSRRSVFIGLVSATERYVRGHYSQFLLRADTRYHSIVGSHRAQIRCLA